MKARPAGPVVEAFVPQAGAEPVPGYRLGRLRGRGGFATVWEADGPDGRVALKFMSSANPGTTAKEVRAIRAVMAVEHPRLLRIRDVWSVPGHVVIGMDLADASLLDLLLLYLDDLGRHIEPEKLCRYLFPVAEALDFLNSRRHRIDGRVVGLQHGDVKPNNILLAGDEPMLADYGLATPTAGPLTPCPRHGTAEYCAPEVFQGNLTDKSDQYSLAVTYHVLRTGAFPFPPPPADGLKDYRRPDPDLSRLLPAERPAVGRALDPIPQQRFVGSGEFLAAVLFANDLKVVRPGSGVIRVESARADDPDGPKSSLRSQMFR